MDKLLKLLPKEITEELIREFFSTKENPNPDLDSLDDIELQAIANDVIAYKKKKKRVRKESFADLAIVLRGNGFNLNEQQVQELAVEAGKDPSHLVKGDIDTVVKFAIERSNQETAIAPVTRSELVSDVSQSMGVVLNVEEITAIADNLDYLSTDLANSLEEIRIAIINYIQHKTQLNSQIIRQTFEEISQAARNGLDKNSQELLEGMQSVSEQVEAKNADFKRTLKAALSAFKIPVAG